MKGKFISWIIFILLCFIWGSSFKLMKDSSTSLSAAQIAALRIFSAGLVFIPFALFHFSQVPKNKLGKVILSGLFGNLVPAFLFALALTRLDASLGGILNSLTPICVVIVGVLFFKARTGRNKLIGVLTGFAGLALLTLFPVFTGEKRISMEHIEFSLLIVAGTFSYGININMVAHRLQTVNPLKVATVSLAFMTIPTFLVLLQQHFFRLDFTNANVQYAVFSSAGLGIVGSALATALFYVLVKRAGGLFASLVTYGIPFIALLWDIVDGRHIPWYEYLCLGIILFGVYLANLPDRDLSPEEDAAIKTVVED